MCVWMYVREVRTSGVYVCGDTYVRGDVQEGKSTLRTVGPFYQTQTTTLTRVKRIVTKP